MKIGIDLSPIQGPHRMRGIGYTLINLVNSLPTEDRKQHSFVFYVLPDDACDFGDPLSILDLQDMDYEVRPLKPKQKISRKLPGRLNLIVSALNSLLAIKELRFGDTRIKSTHGLDVFLQTDQSQSLPRSSRLKKILVIYDIIPYVLEWDYLWSYKTARTVHGFSRKAAWRCSVRRWLYIFKLKLNINRANRLLSISNATKQDFLKTFRRLKASDIEVTPLGVTIPDIHSKDVTLKRYIPTSWDYQAFKFDLDTDTPFLLFVGGADKRRKLQDVVTAFNALRAQGISIRLVLAGDSMKGPESISTEEIQGALKTSSYLNDIVFLGFVDDNTRDWLYKHALAYVFPSRYEGFGLPVLEAFVHECPVISYRSDAVYEVAGDAPLYVNSSEEIIAITKKLLKETPAALTAIRRKGLAQAKNYDWSKTSSKIMSLLGKN